MSDIQYQFQSTVTIEGGTDVVDAYKLPSTSVEQSQVGLFRNVQAIGTTEEGIDTGSIGTIGLAVFRNLDATNYVEVGTWETGGGLPANSQVLIDATGVVWMKSVTNGLWYQVQMQGTDGSAALAVGQTGGPEPVLPTGVFYPFLKLKPLEGVMCRLSVVASSLYARANTAQVELFCLLYEN